MRTGPNLIELPSESGNITKVVCRGSGQSIGQDNHKRRKADERDQKLAPHVVTLASTKRSHAKMVEARGAKLMIFGAHVIVYSKDATADRAFFKKVLGFSSVDAGGGWLIFALPPAEVAVHPAEVSDRHELFFVCADLKAEIAALKEKGVKCSEVQEERWGSITRIRLPGGGELGLYQPKHPLAMPITSVSAGLAGAARE